MLGGSVVGCAVGASVVGWPVGWEAVGDGWAVGCGAEVPSAHLSAPLPIAFRTGR
ncbi:hypothetical protein [Streptomyces sp. CBMA29]|uniref:hypothetical protein n=1 Tax=Streptomyces sp. CBMA29 TaxID=1896314 RepID=UPI001661AAC3|nr:hypothetical protein [Streptomyces sp. CBMA29]